MNQSIGAKFPDLELTDHTAKEVTLSELAMARYPLFVIFYRGYW